MTVLVLLVVLAGALRCRWALRHGLELHVRVMPEPEPVQPMTPLDLEVERILRT